MCAYSNHPGMRNSCSAARLLPLNPDSLFVLKLFQHVLIFMIDGNVGDGRFQ